MRLTISTKFLGATNTHPARVKATAAGVAASVTVTCRCGSDREDHFRAARLLKAKLDWEGEMVAGATETGIVFVFDDGETIE